MCSYKSGDTFPSPTHHRLRDGQLCAIYLWSEEIQASRLYKQTHQTFEAYCRERWGFKRQTTYDYMYAAEVGENVRSVVQTPPSLTQAMRMAPLEPEQQRNVASRVCILILQSLHGLRSGRTKNKYRRLVTFCLFPTFMSIGRRNPAGLRFSGQPFRTQSKK